MFDWFRRAFSPIVRALWQFLKELFSAATEVLMAELRVIAIESVLAVAGDPSIINDDKKRKAAFELVKNKAIESGLDAKDHLINLAIELALAHLKKSGRLNA